MQTTNQSDDTVNVDAKRQSIHKKIIIGLWAALIAGMLGFATLMIVASYGKIPSFESLENPKNNFASVVFTADGSTLGAGYYRENRVPVDFEEISPNVINALIAKEDERYYDHSGIDFRGLMRVLVKTVMLQNQSAGGGSTISQQLAKLLFTGQRAKNIGERGIQKLREWITAIKLERTYTKEEIMTMYLNEFEFINGAFGIKGAAETYFGKSQDSLKIEEAAVIVGMLQNPSLYNPVRFKERTLKQREVVLKQMQKVGYITQVEYDSLRALPIGLNYNRQTFRDGLAPHFRIVLRNQLMAILKSDNAEKKSDGSNYDIFADGLKIYTTLDPKIQKHAEAAAIEHMAQLQKTFFKEWRNLDPWTYVEEKDDWDELSKETRETTKENMLAIRQNMLKRLIRETDLYQDLKKKYLGKDLDALRKEYPNVRLRDADLERMLNSNKGIATLISENRISANQASNYRKVKKSKAWKNIEKNWSTFQRDVKTSFEKPTKMKVFAYNASMEKDTVMSPLEAIKYHRMFLQIGSMAVDPITGHVKAWVGGVNHKYFQYDHVTSLRQVGSTFKPFVYATAIQNQGFSPCMEVLDVQHTIKVGESNFILSKDWSPDNFSPFTNRKVTLQEGLKKSLNSVSVFLMKELGSPKPVVDIVSRMGIDTKSKYSNGQRRIMPVPSLALGATDLSVQEMTGAYTVFANNGIYNKPIFITRIEDRNGRVIYEDEPVERKALGATANYVMVEMLKNAARGKRDFYKIKTEAGGKTGTTNDHVDGWFMGITPNLVVGTWVGGEDQWIRFRNKSLGQGGKMAYPYFAKLMVKIEADKELDFDTKATFFKPPGELGIELDCSKYRTVNDVMDMEEEDDEFFDDIYGDEIESDTTRIF
ncbi:MAG: transglycosylase domain-containing protein [Bacteroidota bacterium]